MQAERFCADNNMVAISLDSRAKEDHFLGLLAQVIQLLAKENIILWFHFRTGRDISGREAR